MIGQLHGTLLAKQPPEVLLDVNGVGYEVMVPMTTYFQLPDLKQTVTLVTHFAVSENSQTLYGFYQQRDRQLFRTLIKVSGVGPKMALAILSGMEADQLVACVQRDDVAALVKVPGVGKKTAERLIIELRDKLKDWFAPAAEADEALASNIQTLSGTGVTDINAEAESALVALGYKPTEAAKVVAKVSGNSEVNSSEELIRLCLKSFAA